MGAGGGPVSPPALPREGGPVQHGVFTDRKGRRRCTRCKGFVQNVAARQCSNCGEPFTASYARDLFGKLLWVESAAVRARNELFWTSDPIIKGGATTETAMDTFTLFAPFAKIDEEKQQVFGYASSPTRDRQGEVVLPEAVRDALPEYWKMPAVREMHAAKAVGKGIEGNVGADGRFWFGAAIVDQGCWNKIKHNVLRGFSLGGRVLERDPNDRSVITKLMLNEISVVDRPANPDSQFTLLKRFDGGLMAQPTQCWSCGDPRCQHKSKIEASLCMAKRREPVPSYDELAKAYDQLRAASGRLIDLAKDARRELIELKTGRPAVIVDGRSGYIAKARR
jgi:phage head maturation protease